MADRPRLPPPLPEAKRGGFAPRRFPAGSRRRLPRAGERPWRPRLRQAWPPRRQPAFRHQSIRPRP
ncbi:hypothetical protein OB03_12925 [Brevundimonas sp. GN22]